ncbi:MAG: DNA polymerase III subunit delta' [Coriobacteriia bacterium]|nr:DNA polymerase III subunit delta' [Coriobacteriia bacterium]MCL2870222.1 DNA polymerase III subunit delta' [Coriobacteriia bacterium]
MTAITATSQTTGHGHSTCAQFFWDKVIGQDGVVRALKHSLDSETLAHAYLFVGAQGLGKINAARAVATQLMCASGGCGNCHICKRLENNSHPDFQVLEPAGAGGYLVEQIRELNYQVQLAPAEADRKIFIIRDVDLFNVSAANAFLKTLEEPTDSTIFILLSHSQEAVLPTIRSRCQIYRFRPLNPEQAREALYEKTGISGHRADIALAANGYIVAAARDYLQSPKQQEARQVVLRAFRHLSTADDLDVLRMTREVLRAALDSVTEMRTVMDSDLLMRKELLDLVALKQLERYNERRLSAFETRQTMMVLSVFSTLLADYLRINCTGLATANRADEAVVPDDIICVDIYQDLQKLAQSRPVSAAKIAHGQERIAVARRRLARSVNVELLMEALLFDLREVIT